MDKVAGYAKGKSHPRINRKAIESNWNLIKWKDTAQSIVDVGIGDGGSSKEAILPLLPNNVEEYFGMDASANMLRYSESIIDHPKYTTVQMDICTKELPLEYTSRFDKAFALFLLHMLSSNVR